MPPSAWSFEGCTLDLIRGALFDASGAEVALRPKSFAFLRLLVENAGRLLGRDTIMAAVWPGVLVTDKSITRCVCDLRKALGDDAQRMLRTVPKRGYLLAAAVTQIEAPVAMHAAGDRPRSGVGGPSARSLPSLPDRPSIAVLPFQNLSGDPGQDYFADGMVEDITTELARLRWLFVIARNSSFTYRGLPHDVRQVGRELGVRYALEGSVRRAGDRVRITGQLIDTGSGVHLWADHFDGERADIFDLQDRLTASVVGAIAPRLEEAEIGRAQRKPTGQLDAYDCFLRGMAAFHRFTAVDNKEASALFARAIALDPDYAAAHGMAARCYLQRKAFGWATLSGRDVAEAERLARRAAELGREDAVALGAAAGTLLTVVAEVEDGVALIDRAAELNPNLAWVWNYSAYARLFVGEPAAALEHASRAIRLSPHDPQLFGIQTATALAHFFLGDDREALAWAEIAVRQQPNFLIGTCVVAASGALAGNVAAATAAIKRLRRINPALRLGHLPHLLPFRRPVDFARWADGLLKAGLPE